MRIYPIPFESFSPSKLLIESKRDAYEANGHEYLAASSAQHQIKMRVRQIAASAVRYQKDRLPDKPQIMEPDLLKVLEILEHSLTRGTDHPCPFSDEDVRNLSRIFLAKPGTLDSWEMALKGSLQAAEQEVAYESLLLYDIWLHHLLTMVRNIRASLYWQGKEAELAGEVTTRFFQFCGNDEGSPWSDEQRIGTRVMVEEFFKLYNQALASSSEAEIRAFLTRFVGERLATRHECSLQEWLFLFSTMEHVLHRLSGPADSLHLADHFVRMQNMASCLTFVGRIHRAAPEIVQRASRTTAEIELHPLLQLALSGLLSSQGSADSADVPLVPWAIVQGQSVFSKTDGQSMIRAAKALCDAALAHAERNWVDLLETQLQQMAAAAGWRSQRRMSAPWFDQLAEKASANLAEGLDTLRNNPRLLPDLLALIDHACLSDLFHNNPQRATAYLRRWFVLNVAIAQMDQGWQHAKTIRTALQTAFRQAPPDELSEVVGSALENLSALESWGKECAEALEVWPHATTHSLSLERYITGANCQRDALWVMRQAVISSLHYGPLGAVNGALKWIAREIAPFADTPHLTLFGETYQKLCLAVQSHETISKHGITLTLKKLAEQVNQVVFVVRLWHRSDDLGAKAAEAIYQALPEYAELSGANSKALCARDSAMILRRTALGFMPGVPDRFEFVEFWWNNVVSLYLATRTPRLFQVQVRELANACESGIGSPSGKWIKETLTPILTGASGEPQDDIPYTLQFRSLVPVLSGAHILSHIPFDGRWFATWLSSKLSPALEYSRQNSLPGFDGSHTPLTEVDAEGLLNEFLPDFVASGYLQSPARTKAYDIMADNAGRLAQFERLLVGLIYQSEDLGKLQRPVVIDYLQSWIEWSRMARAGLWLADHSENFACVVSEYVHEKVPQLTATGVSAASSQKCSRDFGLLLNSVARMLQTTPLPAVGLHTHRYLVQMIAPYTGYSRDIWRMMWQAADMHLKNGPDPAATAVLRTLFHRLQSCGRELDWVAPIARKINADSAPIFSADQSEEIHWRDTVNCLLARILSERKDHPEPEASLWTAASIPLEPATVAGRLDDIIIAMGEWFVDLDLRRLRQTAGELRTELSKRNLFMDYLSSASALGAKVAGVLQTQDMASASWAWAIVARDAIGQAPAARSAWGIPACCAATLYFDGQAAESWRTQAERLKTAAVNLLSVRLGDSAHPELCVQQVADWLNESDKSESWWKAALEIKTGARHGKTCQRDMSWLARRASFLSSETGSDEWLAWYQSEVLTYAGQHEITVVESLLRELAEELLNHPAATPRVKAAAALLKEQIPLFTLALNLACCGDKLAAEAVAEALKSDPGISTDPERCERDTLLTLTAVRDSLHPELHADDPLAWWSESVRPFLQPTSLQLVGKIYGEVIKAAERHLPSTQSDILSKRLRPFIELAA
jgi:hypothetical protein